MSPMLGALSNLRNQEDVAKPFGQHAADRANGGC